MISSCVLVQTPMVSAHVMQAACFSYQVSANVMQAVYRFVCISYDTICVLLCTIAILVRMACIWAVGRYCSVDPTTFVN